MRSGASSRPCAASPPDSPSGTRSGAVPAACQSAPATRSIGAIAPAESTGRLRNPDHGDAPTFPITRRKFFMYNYGRSAAALIFALLGCAIAYAQVPAGYPADYKAIVDGAKKE